MDSDFAFILAIGGFLGWNACRCFMTLRRKELSWGVRVSRILTRIGIAFFFVSSLLNPLEVTISWSWFLSTYGVMFLASVAGLLIWLFSRFIGDRVEPFHAVIYILLIIAFFVVLYAPIYRLRWF